MDFKAQIIKDLKVFHNPGEFAEMMCIWYDGQQYEVPAVLDHLTGTDRQKPGGDNAEGIYRAEAMFKGALNRNRGSRGGKFLHD